MSSRYFTSCKDCTDRSEGCHSTCERYLAEKAKYEKIKDSQRADNIYGDYHANLIVSRREKELKKKNRTKHPRHMG